MLQLARAVVMETFFQQLCINERDVKDSKFHNGVDREDICNSRTFNMMVENIMEGPRKCS